MNPKAANLDQIERWMQSMITHPGGVEEGLDDPETRRHLDVSEAELESVIRPSRSQSSSARLEIYVDAYHERLMECLREEFTATRSAVGDELFDALAFGYLQRFPSRSYTLNRLGANFAVFLDESRLHAQAVPDGGETSWPDFIVELAIFERLQRDVFDAPGIEGRAPLDADQLLTIPPDNWPALALIPAPCLRLITTNHPVHTYWNALKQGAQPSPPAQRRTFLAINRREYTVERHELSGVQFALIKSLSKGQTLLAAIAAASARPDSDAGGFEADLREWFAQWIRLGFFVGLSA